MIKYERDEGKRKMTTMRKTAALTRSRPANGKARANEPTLDAGDHLTRDEFLHIWEQLPNIKRAELIGGVVHMPSPQRKEHGTADFRITGWMGYYMAFTPGCEGGSNTTSLIGDDCLQPDEYMAILPECGGASWGEKYLEGSPEMVAEVSFSSVSMDLHEKLEIYQRANVQEYLVVLVKMEEIRWHRLVKGKYKLVRPDGNGVYRSLVFPGLWLDSKALFANDLAKMLATLQKGIDSDEHQEFVAKLAERKRKS